MTVDERIEMDWLTGKRKGHGMKFRKRVIEAIHYEGFNENGKECEVFLGADFETHLPSKDQIIINTLEGEMTCSAGDWIIRGVKGEHYCCRQDIFEATYEPVGDTDVR